MAIISLNNLTNEHARVVDDKAIALSQLSGKFNAPDGFVITSEVFDYVFEHTGLKHKIKNLTSVINPEDSDKLQNIANEIQKLVVKTELPADVKEAVTEAYQSLGLNQDTPLDDMMENQSEPLVELDAGPVNYLDEGVSMYNVNSSQRFIEALLSAYGLHYASRSLKKRLEHGLEDRGVSVTVKRILNPELSGKAKIENDKLIVEAVFGYYADEIKESSDVYTLNKDSLEVLDVKQRDQNTLAKVVDNNISVDQIPEDFISKKKIEPIQEFASMIKNVFNDSDVNEFEFTLVEKKLYITAVTYSETEKAAEESQSTEFYEMPEDMQEQPQGLQEELQEEEQQESSMQDEQAASDEEQEDKSIFSVFKDQSDEENPYYNKEPKAEYSLESARHALGYAVLECNLVIRKRLEEAYRDIFREEPPSALREMLEAISDYKTVPFADELGKISELSRRFTRDGQPPNIMEVKYTLEKAQQFLDQFS